MTRRSLSASFAVAAILVACSSVPDVEFVPDDVDAVDSGGPSATDAAGRDSATSGNDGSASTDSAVPDTCTKASRDDLCCGKTLCSGGCSVDDCAGCVADCASQGDICCRKGKSIQCRPAAVGCR